MAVTVISGDFAGTAGNLGVLAGIQKRSVVDQVYYEEPQAAPLILLLRRAGRRSVSSFKHEWTETQRMPTVDQINNSGGYTAGATSIVVDNGGYFFPNCLVKNQRTNEVYHVTAVSTNTLTVVRSWGATAAAAINDNDYVQILGGIALEGTTSEIGRHVKDVQAHNFIQEFRDPFSLTWIQDKTATYGGDYFARKRAERGREHKVYIENALFFNERGEDTSGDEARRSLGGMEEFISTNSTNFSGLVSWEEILTSAQDDFRYGSDTKLLFISRGGASSIESLAMDKVRTGRAEKTFGLRISRLETGHGSYLMIPHPLFEGGENAKKGFVIDPKNIRYAAMIDTKLRRDLQDNSATAMKEEWYTAATIERALERTHAKWTNVA